MLSKHFTEHSMKQRGLAAIAAATLVSFTPAAARAQRQYDPVPVMAAQRAAMVPLAAMDGVWRGPAWTILESGEKHSVTQTERVGPFLDGAVKVMEGRAYDSEGKVSFNAFGTVSYDPATKAYTMHTYAMGRVGDFPLTVSPEGFVWEIPAGPMKIRYTAVIKDGKWREVGDRIMPGQEPMRFFEMNLVRVGDSDWPTAGAIPQK
jgi:hypothetical protein